MNNIQSSSHDEEIDLFVIASLIWAERITLIKAVAVSLVLAILYLQIATHKYTVSYKVTPVSESSSSSSGSLGQLASLAGANLNLGSDNGSFELYLVGMHSFETAKTLTENESVLKQAFPKYWDSETEKWQSPYGIGTVIKYVFNLIVSRPTQNWEKPTAAQLQEFLEEEVRVSKSMDNSVVGLSIETANITFGKELLSALHTIVDENLRKKSLERSKNQINYLTAKLQEVRISEHRQILAASLLEQENTSMMASSDLPFSAEPFGAPYSSLKPTNPNPIIVLILAIFLGLFVSIIWILLLNKIGRQNTDYEASH